jgi:hypothetical protein
VSAEIDTIGGEAKDELFVTYHGEPLSGPMTQLVTNALQVRRRRRRGAGRARTGQRSAPPCLVSLCTVHPRPPPASFAPAHTPRTRRATLLQYYLSLAEVAKEESY